MIGAATPTSSAPAAISFPMPTPRGVNALRSLALSAVAALLALHCADAGERPPGAPNDEQRPPRTSSSVSVDDLRARLYAFANDSMEGRHTGTGGADRATAYLATELGRLGLEPAGDEGTFFQRIPLARVAPRQAAERLTVGDEPLRPGDDFVALTPHDPAPPLDGSTAIYGGRAGAGAPALSPERYRGRLVVVAPSGPGWRDADLRALGRFPGAAAVALAALDVVPPEARRALVAPVVAFVEPGRRQPRGILITEAAAEALLGGPLRDAIVGQGGARPVRATLPVAAEPLPARNVVALLRGADPALAGQVVVLGAHHDHLGIERSSARRRVALARRLLAGSPAASARRTADSLATLLFAPLDTVLNGADDDGSGSVALLEIAEAMSAGEGGPRPKRSVLFVWHGAEEQGWLGAKWLTARPPVATDSMVAMLDADMIGRGAGTPTLLQLFVGISHGSPYPLADRAVTVAARGRHVALDRSHDDPADPRDLFCGSDHVAYAGAGVPVAFFTTGTHADQHQPADGPERIHYGALEDVTRYLLALAFDLADGRRVERGGGEGADCGW